MGYLCVSWPIVPQKKERKVSNEIRMMENNFGRTVPLKCLQVLLLIHVFMILWLHFRNVGMFSSSCPGMSTSSQNIISGKSPLPKQSVTTGFRANSSHCMTSRLHFCFAMAAEHISLYHRDTLYPIIHLPQGKTFCL